MKKIFAFVAIVAAGCAVAMAQSQQQPRSEVSTFGETEMSKVQEIVNANVPENMGIGKVSAKRVAMSGDTLVVTLTENFRDVPFTRESVEKMRADFKAACQKTNAVCQIMIDGNDIEKFFPEFDKKYARKHSPFVTEQDPNKRYKNGLDGNIVALWQSHGWYFEDRLNRWEWQRARMFQTVEDMYTQSYVVPYLIPMLENAGCYVWDARERDTHNFASVVDADGGLAQTRYVERNGANAWQTGQGAGFAYLRASYKDYENPFQEGSYRMVKATKDKKNLSLAHYDVEMPEAGKYALYISYKSLENSAKDVQYTVNSLNGTKAFTVDQTMAGGVWVYLGTFELEKGVNKDVVVISNLSKDANAVVTTDAIKVGGGKGNIARRVALPTEENKALAKELGFESHLGKEGVEYDYVDCGGRPWFVMGSRYYLQWAGFPKTVYSSCQGLCDYNDDYKSRGIWVNHLAGGSEVIPNANGLKVPVDLSFAFHTDAGTTQNDDIIGTLNIYCTKDDNGQFGKYADGTPRIVSRELANQISTNICQVVRAKYEPNWKRRGMWDSSYFEARVPEVPAVLLEHLSHQNFADMKYGLDPNFRFDVSRAIYKGMLKFLAKRDHRDYVVQPLPVNSFAIQAEGDHLFTLTWKPTVDSLEATAMPTKYVVCERVADGGFREIAVVTEPRYTVNPGVNAVYSYQIIAMNEGGRSFPSEVLAVGIAPNSKDMVAVVNDFTRVSGPDWYDSGKMAGFDDIKDHGVPDVQQINYIGTQHEFERRLPWVDDDDPGFGACQSNYENGEMVVAGNTHDFVGVHGAAIMKAGYSFVSMSEAAFVENGLNAAGYKAIDIILGKQKETMNGRGAKPSRYKIFTPAFMEAVKAYTAQGGNVLMTGAYVASDIWQKEKPVEAEVEFAKTVMGYQHRASRADVAGQLEVVASPFTSFQNGTKMCYEQQLNAKQYAAESPDAVKAADADGATIMRYSGNTKPAAVAVKRPGYRTVVAGFPFETIKCEQQRNAFMQSVLNFFAE